MTEPHSLWDIDQHLEPKPRKPSPDSPAKTTTPYFKDHFPEIIAYIYLSRYVTAEHVYRRFPNHFKNDRTCRRHLQHLDQHFNHLTCVDVRSTSITFPKVYTATRSGITLIKKHFPSWDIPYTREEATHLPNVMHELDTTTFELECWAAIKDRPDLAIKGMTERRYFLKQKQLNYVADGVANKLTPDAGFILGQSVKDDTRLLLHLIEMDMGTESHRIIKEKLVSYDDWINSPHGINYLKELYASWGRPTTKPNFRLLFIIRSNHFHQHVNARLLQLYQLALTLDPAIRNLIWFTTVQEIAAAARSGVLPLAEPIWWRGRHAAEWLDDFHIFSANLKRGRGQTPSRHEKTYLAKKLQDMPRACLLPDPPDD